MKILVAFLVLYTSLGLAGETLTEENLLSKWKQIKQIRLSPLRGPFYPSLRREGVISSDWANARRERLTLEFEQKREKEDFETEIGLNEKLHQVLFPYSYKVFTSESSTHPFFALDLEEVNLSNYENIIVVGRAKDSRLFLENVKTEGNLIILAYGEDSASGSTPYFSEYFYLNHLYKSFIQN